MEARYLKPGMEVPIVAKLNVEERGGVGTDMAQLLGWFVTEGKRKRANTIRIYQLHECKPRSTWRRFEACYTDLMPVSEREPVSESCVVGQASK